MSDNGFRFGDWQIDPDSNTLRNDGASATVEPKAMDVLRYLCRHAGAVIPPEELLQACWGNAELGDNPIHKAITQLRRALGDSASEPRYIETVRKRGYRAIAPVMAGEEALEGSWQQGSPFRGLESFQESHAAIFFGRMQATAQLRELVLKQASDGCAMALVLGPSGSGKTSLVRAGLLPGLMASRTGSGEPVALACTLYMDCADLADGNLFQALAAVLMDAEVGGKLLFTGENAEGLGRWLESSDAAAIAGRLTEASGRIKIGLFVDRLEAIFRAPGVTDEIRSRFIAVLEYLASSRAVLVMLACRNDFYPEVIALPALMALKSRGGHFDLNPPDGAEIAQMVRMPAKAAGLKFEVDAATGASLDDVLCDAARGSPDALPLLQYCLDELYRQRGEDGTLRYSVFHQLGNIEGAIAVRAEQAVASMPASQAAALPHVLSLIVDVTEDQANVTARRVPWDSLQSNDARELLKGLVDARLFVSELTGNTPCFSVTHEALLRRWPRVVQWIELHRAALQVRSRISKDMARWMNAGCPRDLLIPQGSQVNQAKDLLALMGFALPESEKEYVLKSWSRARLADRLKLAVMIIVTGLALLAAVLGIFARQAQLNAEQHRIEAEGLLSYMLGDFVEKLRPIGKLELLDGVSKKALTYLTQLENEGATPESLEQRAKALQVIGEVNINRANPSEATKALLSARSILLTALEKRGPNKAVLKNLGENAFWLGKIYLDRREFNQAEKYFKEYLNSSKHLASLDNEDIDGLIEQAYAHNAIGGVALKRGNFKHAELEFSESIKLERDARRRYPDNNKILVDLANSLSWQADATSKSGHLLDAMKLFEEESSLLHPIHESDTSNATWAYRLALALWHQADLHFAFGQPNLARQKYLKAVGIVQSLLERDKSNQKWQLALLTLQIKTLEAREAFDSKRELIKKHNAIFEKLQETLTLDPKRTQLLQLMALSKLDQGVLFAELGDVAQATLRQSESMSIIKRMQGTQDSAPLLAEMIANGHLLQADIELLNNQQDNAITACKSALSALAHYSNGTSSYSILVPYVRAQICAGNSRDANNAKERLHKMAYRETRYLSYLNTHPDIKGSQ